MKSFRQYLKSDVDLMPASTTDDLQPDNVGQIANINIMLKRVSNDIYKNPYEALQRLRQQLAYYSIHLPKFIFTNPTSGETAFEVQQFGGPIGMDTSGRVKTEPDPASMFIYFSWNVNDEGMYEIDAELMDEDNLEGILGGQEEDAEDANALAYRQADNIMGEEALDEQALKTVVGFKALGALRSGRLGNPAGAEQDRLKAGGKKNPSKAHLVRDTVARKNKTNNAQKRVNTMKSVAKTNSTATAPGNKPSPRTGAALNNRINTNVARKRLGEEQIDVDEGLFDRFKSKEKKPTTGIKSNSSGATAGKWRASFDWADLDNNENKSILKKGRANLIAHYGYGFSLKDGKKSLGDGHWRYSKGFTFEDGPLKGKTYPTPERVLAAVSNIREEEELIDEGIKTGGNTVLIVNKKIVAKGSKKAMLSKMKIWKGENPSDKISIGLSPNKKVGDLWGELNELSPATYKAYKDRAKRDKRTLDWVGDDEDEGTQRKKNNRSRGIKQAQSKTKLNELSPNALQRYVDGAQKDKKHNTLLKKYSTKKEFKDEADGVINKRERGLKQARKKLGLNKEQ
jgi:hypothetical protein